MKTLKELKAEYEAACDAAWAAYYVACAAESHARDARDAASKACDAAREACDAYKAKLKEIENENIG